MLNTRLPDGLCPAHHDMARKYRENHYNPRRPSEWPGGIHIVDARTSHAERERRWDEKNLEAIEQIAAICRSRCSPEPAQSSDVKALPDRFTRCGSPTS